MKILICGSHIEFLTPEGWDIAYALIEDEIAGESCVQKFEELEWVLVTGAGPNICELAHEILLDSFRVVPERITAITPDYAGDGSRKARALAYKQACELADEVWVFWAGAIRDGAKWSIRNALSMRKDIRVRFI